MLSSPDVGKSFVWTSKNGSIKIIFFCLPGKLCHRISVYTWENKLISSCRCKTVRDNEPKWYPAYSWSIRDPLCKGVYAIPFQDSLKISDDRLESKSVGKHLEIIISMKNTDHALIAFFISVFQWNAPKANMNKLNCHEKEAELFSLTQTELPGTIWGYLRHPGEAGPVPLCMCGTRVHLKLVNLKIISIFCRGCDISVQCSKCWASKCRGKFKSSLALHSQPANP